MACYITIFDGLPSPLSNFNIQRDARKHRGQISIKSNDTYNVEDIVMPLHEYINHPIARDIIHNGATFQVL